MQRRLSLQNDYIGVGAENWSSRLRGAPTPTAAGGRTLTVFISSTDGEQAQTGPKTLAPGGPLTNLALQSVAAFADLLRLLYRLKDGVERVAALI